jgi:hypothetical protein
MRQSAIRTRHRLAHLTHLHALPVHVWHGVRVCLHRQQPPHCSLQTLQRAVSSSSNRTAAAATIGLQHCVIWAVLLLQLVLSCCHHLAHVTAGRYTQQGRPALLLLLLLVTSMLLLGNAPETCCLCKISSSSSCRAGNYCHRLLCRGR